MQPSKGSQRSLGVGALDARAGFVQPAEEEAKAGFYAQSVIPKGGLERRQILLTGAQQENKRQWTQDLAREISCWTEEKPVPFQGWLNTGTGAGESPSLGMSPEQKVLSYLP